MTATRRQAAARAQAEAVNTEVLPAAEAQAIAALDEARRQIDIARASEDIDTLLEWTDRAAAVTHYYKRREEARELADNAGEIKVRAEAALGKLDLKYAPSRRGGPKPKSEEAAEGEEEAPSPLAQFQPNRRSAFRTLGQLDSNQLDGVVTKLRSDDEGGVTTSRAVRAAREVLPIEHRDGTGAPGKPSKEQRKQLVTDYVDHVRALDSEANTLVRLARKMMPVATDGERSRIAKRLNDTVEKLAELAEGMSVGEEPLEGELVDDE